MKLRKFCELECFTGIRELLHKENKTAENQANLLLGQVGASLFLPSRNNFTEGLP
jgi:hypothetical protein